jgi:hypothetical protein
MKNTTIKNPTVESLRKEGNDVRIWYYKNIPVEGIISKFISPRVTVARITKPDGQSAEGISICSPHDRDNRKRALQIAVGRAYKALRSGKPLYEHNPYYLNIGFP